jgi:Cft2 family RNA processing exonuclease
MKITFLGAAREVTGSCFLVETAAVKFLVDCGVSQGGREAAQRNQQPFAFDPKNIDFVLLTHAHIDHSSLLPRLTRAGFGGTIHATAATVDRLQVVLPDSAHIQEMDALRAARRVGKARDTQATATPLYTLRDADACLQQVRPHGYGEVQPHVDVRCRFRNAGHILGSAILEIWGSEGERITKLVFSGDLGQPDRVILRDPTRIAETDIPVIDGRRGRRGHADSAATHGTVRRKRQTPRRLARARQGSPYLHFSKGTAESIALNPIRSGAIIISASGMCTAGRIKHHLRHNLGRPEYSLLITGFQAQGTLGRRLVDDASQVRIFDDDIPVRASIHTVGGLSAHADRNALLTWAAGFERPPAHTIVVHGEDTAAQALAAALRVRPGWEVILPAPGQHVQWRGRPSGVPA